MQEPTLLMIHGLTGSLGYFDPQRRISKARARPIDLLGYGSLRSVERSRLTLRSQAEHVVGHIELLGPEPLWLLGHSMGGAVAMLVADMRPDLVTGIVNVEGNFTLEDAFWSKKIATKNPGDWSREYDEMGSDVTAWLPACDIRPTPQRVEWGTAILNFQPPATVYHMSRAIVEETGNPSYLDMVRQVVDRGLPIHLIAGEHSAKAWDVPGFVRQAAGSYVEIAGAGHLMMLEEPDAFCQAVDSALETIV